MLTEIPVSGLSLNELSRRAGLAKPNVLRYFESREAVLLELLDSEVTDWMTELARAPADEGTPTERADRLAELLAGSLSRRPVLCDLLSAQGAVLEHNISTEVGIRHKRQALQAAGDLSIIIARHLPELADDGISALVELTLLVAISAWQCSRPSEAMLAVYSSGPELAVMRVDFAAVMRRAVVVTTAGLFALRPVSH